MTTRSVSAGLLPGAKQVNSAARKSLISFALTVLLCLVTSDKTAGTPNSLIRKGF